MVEPSSILSLSERIARKFRPQRIILFGSYAYGRPDEDSDVDLLIVMPHVGPAHRKATQIRLSVLPKFPLDLLVRSPRELRLGVSEKDWFVVEVFEKGIVLHDRADRAVGAKGRSRFRRRFAAPAVAQA